MDSKKKKLLEGILLLFMCCCPLVIITGCGSDSCVRCTACGDDDTRFFVYASGVSENGVEYTSCVGPAGCLGIGCNSKCWPTECTSVKKSTGTSVLSGNITYYNEAGCIANTGVKSNGTYSEEATCMGIGCGGSIYNETVAESTQAWEKGTCLGISCGEKVKVEPKNYNDDMPRAFPNGCWASDKS